jgi:hypothetical protein
MPNNPNLISISINLSPQQLIVATVNIPPTIDATIFVDLVGEFFQVLELEFSIKSFEKICPKWPRIGHLDIDNQSYGQKKGRESNWQFDS